jgi:hypothetical protein
MKSVKTAYGSSKYLEYDICGDPWRSYPIMFTSAIKGRVLVIHASKDPFGSFKMSRNIFSIQGFQIWLKHITLNEAGFDRAGHQAATLECL